MLIDRTKMLSDTFRGFDLDSYVAFINKSQLLRITHQYDRSTWYIERTFYFKDSSLIFIKETKNSNFLNASQSNNFYFNNGILIKYTGPTPHEKDIVDIQQVLISDLKKAKKNLQRHLKLILNENFIDHYIKLMFYAGSSWSIL
jgi:uncharacterized membrane protein